jgi:hypothetical protein
LDLNSSNQVKECFIALQKDFNLPSLNHAQKKQQNFIVEDKIELNVKYD